LVHFVKEALGPQFRFDRWELLFLTNAEDTQQKSSLN